MVHAFTHLCAAYAFNIGGPPRSIIRTMPSFVPAAGAAHPAPQ
jgi:hypothetical protein